MKNNTIEFFKGWDKIADYESDETSVTLIDSTGKKIVEYGYSRFTKDDFDRFKLKK